MNKNYLIKLHKSFGTVDADSAAFIHARQHLVPALINASLLIQKFFGNGTRLSLMLTDKESIYPNLFIQIHTTLSQPNASEILEMFEKVWLETETSENLVDLTANLVFE